MLEGGAVVAVLVVVGNGIVMVVGVWAGETDAEQGRVPGEGGLPGPAGPRTVAGRRDGFGADDVAGVDDGVDVVVGAAVVALCRDADVVGDRAVTSGVLAMVLGPASPDPRIRRNAPAGINAATTTAAARTNGSIRSERLARLAPNAGRLRGRRVQSDLAARPSCWASGVNAGRVLDRACLTRPR